jgi:hypothetical protein
MMCICSCKETLGLFLSPNELLNWELIHLKLKNKGWKKENENWKCSLCLDSKLNTRENDEDDEKVLSYFKLHAEIYLGLTAYFIHCQTKELSLSRIQSSIERLQAEGYIYCTGDNHFRFTGVEEFPSPQ